MLCCEHGHSWDYGSHLVTLCGHGELRGLLSQELCVQRDVVVTVRLLDGFGMWWGLNLRIPPAVNLRGIQVLWLWSVLFWLCWNYIRWALCFSLFLWLLSLFVSHPLNKLVSLSVLRILSVIQVRNARHPAGWLARQKHGRCFWTCIFIDELCEDAFSDRWTLLLCFFHWAGYFNRGWLPVGKNRFINFGRALTGSPRTDWMWGLAFWALPFAFTKRFHCTKLWLRC